MYSGTRTVDAKLLGSFVRLGSITASEMMRARMARKMTTDIIEIYLIRLGFLKHLNRFAFLRRAGGTPVSLALASIAFLT
jgi:hypothetical protein